MIKIQKGRNKENFLCVASANIKNMCCCNVRKKNILFFSKIKMRGVVSYIVCCCL